jgi:ABC-2 type transport system permease protein
MLKYLLEKEFKQIQRNPFLPKMILFMPIMMMLVLPWAANQEIKGIQLSIVDHDHSTLSERLIHKIPSSGYFKLTDISQSNEEALKSIDSGKSDIIMEIPNHFERDLYTSSKAPIMISANAVNGMKGGLGSQYLGNILSNYSENLREEAGMISRQTSIPQCKIIPEYKFNPYLDYKVFMVPALMVMLLTMLAGFLPALNIVGEKEKGTIEQINVTPIPKSIFILAKLIPYWIIGFVVLTICFIIAALVYHLIPVGNLFLICIFAAVYIIVVSGMGLVISNYSDTMQQAMFVMWFFIMILILMSGLFTPISSMPDWAQKITIFNPLRYFMQVMRQIYLKGSGFLDLLPHFIALCSFALFLNLWAVLSYKKSS